MSASAPQLPKHNTFCTKPAHLGWYLLYAATHSHIPLALLVFTNKALATGSSASCSALPSKDNGYISTAFEANEKSYDLIKSKFTKETGSACTNAVTNRTGSFRGYTVNPTKKMRPFILPTQVHQEVADKDVFSYVGTTSNVPTQLAIVIVPRDNLIGSALFVFPAECPILKATSFLVGIPFD